MRTFTFSTKEHTVAEFVKTTTAAIVTDVKQFGGEQELYVVEASSETEATELVAAFGRAFSEAPLKKCVVEAMSNEGRPAVFCLAAHK